MTGYDGVDDALAGRDRALAAGPDEPSGPFLDTDECPDECGGSWDDYNRDCRGCGLWLPDRDALLRFRAAPRRYEVTVADLSGVERTFSKHVTLPAARAVALRERDRPPAPGSRRPTEAWMVRDTDDPEAGNLIDREDD